MKVPQIPPLQGMTPLGMKPASAFRTVEFDPNTMTRATSEDVSRIWLQLWGEYSVNKKRFPVIDGEYLDNTQEV